MGSIFGNLYIIESSSTYPIIRINADKVITVGTKTGNIVIKTALPHSNKSVITIIMRKNVRL
jgi:hypothetical protein